MTNYILPAIIISAFVALIIIRKIQGAKKMSVILSKISEGAKIIDVRTSEEFSTGHYDGAINIPLDRIEKNLSKIGAKEKTVIVYCASGMRSAQASNILKSAGFTDVLNAGGLSNMPK